MSTGRQSAAFFLKSSSLPASIRATSSSKSLRNSSSIGIPSYHFHSCSVRPVQSENAAFLPKMAQQAVLPPAFAGQATRPHARCMRLRHQCLLSAERRRQRAPRHAFSGLARHATGIIVHVSHLDLFQIVRLQYADFLHLSTPTRAEISYYTPLIRHSPRLRALDTARARAPACR